MNQVWLLTLSEAVLLLLIALLVLVWRLLKRKKQVALDIENLLAEVKASEGERQRHLIRHLTLKRKIPADTAQQLAQDLQAAEKTFLQCYVQAQFEQKTSAEFNLQLTELLDRYLNLIPTVNPSPVESIPPSVIAPSPAVVITKPPVPATAPLTASALLDAPVPEPVSAAVEMIPADEIADAAPTVITDADGALDLDWEQAFAETENEASIALDDAKNEEISKALAEFTAPATAEVVEQAAAEHDEFGSDLDWEAAFAEVEAEEKNKSA